VYQTKSPLRAGFLFGLLVSFIFYTKEYTESMEYMDILRQGSVYAAENLIGWRLYVREVDGSLTGGVIAETEAYTPEDKASHTHKGETLRNGAMYRGAGTVYVYFSYGMHWCMNLVAGTKGSGEGLLLRSIIPDKGIEIMRQRRNYQVDKLLTNGPGKVCQALGVTGTDNGALLAEGRFILLPPDGSLRVAVTATPRIGISRDTHRLWRFVLQADS